MFRRQAVLALNGYHDQGWPEDYDLWLRMAHAGARFARLPETLFFWRDRPERMTRTADEYTRTAFRNCKVYHLRQSFLARASDVTLWGAGVEGKAWRRSLLANGIAVNRWIEVDPRKIGQIIHGAPVTDIESLMTGNSNDGKILVTVGTRGARQQVRDFAARVGLKEGVELICVT
jgi:hypothetical protein